MLRLKKRSYDAHIKRRSIESKEKLNNEETLECFYFNFVATKEYFDEESTAQLNIVLELEYCFLLYFCSTLSNQNPDTVEPLKTDTPRDRPKCPS